MKPLKIATMSLVRSHKVFDRDFLFLMPLDHCYNCNVYDYEISKLFSRVILSSSFCYQIKIRLALELEYS